MVGRQTLMQIKQDMKPKKKLYFHAAQIKNDGNLIDVTIRRDGDDPVDITLTYTPKTILDKAVVGFGGEE